MRQTVGFRCIKDVVDEFQTPNTSTAKRHCDDLQCSSMRLHNELTERLRKRKLGETFFVDFVLNVSSLTGRKTDVPLMLMEKAMQVDEPSFKDHMNKHYFGEEFDCEIPYAVKDVKSFRAVKPNVVLVKEQAIEVVTKLYRTWCQCHLVSEQG